MRVVVRGELRAGAGGSGPGLAAAGAADGRPVGGRRARCHADPAVDPAQVVWLSASAGTVANLVCNFTPPVGERPALLTHDEVTTLFHEFGHGIHHMLTEVEVATVSGINGVAWDAVELPSQFMENWCWTPEGLALISSHVDSGEPLP